MCMRAIIDLLYEKQKYLIGLAIFLALSAVSITVKDGHTSLNLASHPVLMIGLVALSLFLIIIYIKIDQSKITKLLNEIKSSSEVDDDPDNHPITLLTARQYKVYQLILNGKSNKEIMAELFIEQSTLKTHINQIYKKLNIKSRTELKSKANH